MKKILLSLAAVAMATAAYAQGPNLVKNGSFEEPGVEASVPGGYTWEPWNTYENIDVLPGWTLSTGGEWNGITMWMEEPGDGDARPEDDTHYLRLLGYNNNGWTNISASQIVTGLTAGTNYKLSFVMGVSWCPADQTAWNSAPDPDYYVSVSEVDGEAAGKEIVKFMTPCTEDGYTDQDFQAFEYDFTAPADGKVYLTFVLPNNYYENNKKEVDLFMDIDQVKIYDPNGTGAVNGIVVENEAPVEYYNLQGVRVSGDNYKGVVIRKQGGKSVKIAL